MNRAMFFGIAMFVAVVGIALVGADNKASAGLRHHRGCNGCSASSCDGGCSASADCNGGGCSGSACNGGCHGHRRCHGGLLHRLKHRCHGCNGGCNGGGCNGGGCSGGDAGCSGGCSGGDAAPAAPAAPADAAPPAPAKPAA